MGVAMQRRQLGGGGEAGRVRSDQSNPRWLAGAAPPSARSGYRQKRHTAVPPAKPEPDHSRVVCRLEAHRSRDPTWTGCGVPGPARHAHHLDVRV
eukprot:scaffold4424_cov113-Isochrysis_galbana.AAC.12